MDAQLGAVVQHKLITESPRWRWVPRAATQPPRGARTLDTGQRGRAERIVYYCNNNNWFPPLPPSVIADSSRTGLSLPSLSLSLPLPSSSSSTRDAIPMLSTPHCTPGSNRADRGRRLAVPCGLGREAGASSSSRLPQGRWLGPGASRPVAAALIAA